MEITTINPILSTLIQIHTNPNHPVNLCGDMETIYNAFGLNYRDLEKGRIKLAQLEPVITTGIQVMGSVQKAPETHLLMVLQLFAQAAHAILPCSTTREIFLELETLGFQNAKTENPEIFWDLKLGKIEKAAIQALSSNQKVIELENQLGL